MKIFQNFFHVVIHDVTPQHAKAIHQIIHPLSILLNQQLSVAVVPCWHGTSLSSSDKTFIDFIKENSQEILLHGYTHQNVGMPDILALLTKNSNELTGLSEEVIYQRLHWGQATLQEFFGHSARGFIPPAWQRGRASLKLLSECKIEYYVGMTSIQSVKRESIPLATWSWDVGSITPLGYLSEYFGYLLFATSRTAIRCVVFHPLDVERGFLIRGIRLVQKLLDEGRKPIVFHKLLSLKIANDMT